MYHVTASLAAAVGSSAPSGKWDAQYSKPGLLLVSSSQALPRASSITSRPNSSCCRFGGVACCLRLRCDPMLCAAFRPISRSCCVHKAVVLIVVPNVVQVRINKETRYMHKNPEWGLKCTRDKNNKASAFIKLCICFPKDGKKSGYLHTCRHNPSIEMSGRFFRSQLSNWFVVQRLPFPTCIFFTRQKMVCFIEIYSVSSQKALLSHSITKSPDKTKKNAERRNIKKKKKRHPKS